MVRTLSSQWFLAPAGLYALKWAYWLGHWNNCLWSLRDGGQLTYNILNQVNSHKLTNAQTMTCAYSHVCPCVWRAPGTVYLVLHVRWDHLVF
jgi:hypothetical protein